MAAMTTALTEFRDLGDSRTYTYTGHTAAEPRLVIQRRKVAGSATANAETHVKVVSSTEDAEGNILGSKISMEASVSYPANGIEADVDAALVTFRDIVVGDEFTNSVKTQEWLV